MNNPWINAVRIMLIIPVAMIMLFCMSQITPEAFAAGGPIAKMNGETYWNFNSLASDLSGKGGETVTIEMLDDWDYKDNKKVDERLLVPRSCNLTLNMNGHMFNRRLTKNDDYETNGELFALRVGASVTVNGGDRNKQHEDVYVHSSTDRGKYATKKITTNGGTLSGGSSTNGAGCFHLRANCTVKLNDVTIAGCRAEQRAGSDGYGGAFFLGSNAGGTGGHTIELTNSHIYGCYAYNDGGAIYSNAPSNTIKLKKSSIENNYCAGDGGAIYFNYADTSVSGHTDSSISGNTAAGDGGAIYVELGGANLSGLTFSGNHARKGGAIYINAKGSSIASCKITDNGASYSGGGVYVASGIDDLTVSGDTVIRDSGHNLYISDNYPENSRVSFDLVNGADVHVSYYDTKNRDTIMVTPGKIGDSFKNKNCTKYLTSDNSNYHFEFNYAWNARKIYLKKGKAPAKPTPTEVSAANANDAAGKSSGRNDKAGKVGTVGPGGTAGNDYDLIRGFYLHEKTDSGTEDRTGLFYYTDAFFDDRVDLKKYNEHLATASWVLAFSGTYLRKFELADSDGNTYYNKHAGARQFLADIGCPDQNIYVNDSMVSKPETDSVGCTIGSKELAKADGTKTGKILIPVTVRGGGYEKEWASNCTLGAGTENRGKDKKGEALGFSTAADQVVEAVDRYIVKYGLEEAIRNGDVVFWVAGFSRAGATANITSKRLVEKYADGTAGKSNRVFGYTCEAAKGGTDEAEQLDDKTKYYCIHNMINTADVVPLVAPWQMGFKRYGVDHYIPGTDAGTIRPEPPKEVKHAGSSGINKVTTYADNISFQTKTEEYDHFRDGQSSRHGKTIYQNLQSIDSDIIFDDYFHPMAMDLVPTKIYEDGGYDENRVEDFLEDFFRNAQEGIPNSWTDWSVTIGSRKKWAEDKTTINYVDYSSIQTAMRDTMALVFSMDDEQSESFIEKASEIKNNIDLFSGEVSKWEFYNDIIRNWVNLSEGDKGKYVKSIWNMLKETGALSELSDEDAARLENDWPALADFAFRLACVDYHYYPGKYTDVSKWAKDMKNSMTYIPTFATFSSSILSNHYPEINISWVRMGDDWYRDENLRSDFKEYKIIPPGAVGVPGAYATDKEGKETALVEKKKDPDKDANALTGDQRIILENTDIVGEAVYYNLQDITGGEEGNSSYELTNNIYRGGIDLSLGAAKKKSYKITTFDMSYGVKSELAVYYINLFSNKHDVTVEDTTYTYREGDEVRIIADEPDDKRFTSWAVEDEQGNPVTDLIFTGEYEQYKTRTNALFRMPIPDSVNKLSRDYALTFFPIYDNKISAITANLETPVTGTVLDTAAEIVFNTMEGERFSYPVAWTYELDGKEYAASGPALSKTAYTAQITIPQGEAIPEGATEPEVIAFASEVKASLQGGPEGTVVKTQRDPSDGSVQISITFPATEGDDPPVPETVEMTIKAYDQNTGEYIPGEDTVYQVVPGSVFTVSAETVEDELFVKWNMLESGIRIQSGSETDRTVELWIPDVEEGSSLLPIRVEHKPLVNSIAVKLPAPEGGHEIASAVDSMLVTITDEYFVDSECIQVTWTPAPKKEGDKDIADFEIQYTAMVTLKPYGEGDHAGKIKVRPKKGGDPLFISATFDYGENTAVTMNGEAASLDKEINAVIFTFPETEYELAADAVSPEDETGLPHGTGKEEIKEMLPATLKVLRNDGMQVDAEVDWDDPEVAYHPSGEERGEAEWTAAGTVILPDNMVNPVDKDHPEGIYSLEVSMKLTTKEAAHAASPDASLESGTYMMDQTTTLSTDTEGGTIWYTTDESEDPSWTEYTEGTEIPIDFDPESGRTKVMLRAYTAKTGFWDSVVATYIYEYSNEVDVPGGLDATYNGKSHVGVEGGSFYTLVAAEGSGVTIDEEGNAVAAQAGTYTVTAKIKDGYVWRIRNNDAEMEADESRTTTDDQTIRFTIAPADIADVVAVTAEGRFRTLDDLKKALRVEPTGDLKPVKGDDYDITFGEVKDGKVTVTVTGKGNYTDAITSTFIIDGDEPVKTKYTITFDLNGGSLDGRTGVITEEYYENTVITLPEPSRTGYTFQYWKGSMYNPGDKFTVKKDHTFTAEWEKTSGKDDDPDDGDDPDGGDDPDDSGNPDDGGNPDDSGNPDNGGNPGEDGQSDDGGNGNGTRTGDSSNLLLWLAAMLTAMCGIAGTVLYHRMRRS